MAHDLVRAGVRFPIELAVARPMPLAASGHRVALADVGTSGETTLSGDLFEEENCLDGLASVGEGLGGFRDSISEALSGGINRGPKPVVIRVRKAVARQVTRDRQRG